MDERTLVSFGGARIGERNAAELIGLARGLLADGKLVQEEIEYLQKWLAISGDAVQSALSKALLDRVNDILADGVADEEERADLFDILSRLSGGDFELGELLKSTTLPVDRPEPSLVFTGMNYCFTGTFAYGNRRACEQAVVERGGSITGINRKLHVLVIGTYATSSWVNSSYGGKIIDATKIKADGYPISIVTEGHWVTHL
jgi:NAD-dependent DNA ligase